MSNIFDDNVMLEDPEFRLAYAEEDLIHRIAERVLRFRQLRGMSQSDLAELIGTKQPAVAKLEAGFSNLTIRRLVRVAHALECRPEDLVDRSAPAALVDGWRRTEEIFKCVPGGTQDRQTWWSGDFQVAVSNEPLLEVA